MKKVIFFIAIMVVMCSCDNQEKIQNEVNAAIEQCEYFEKECVIEHAREDADEMCKAIKKRKKTPNLEDKKKLVERDADLILSKCFDSLFEKYGEKKVMDAIIKFASTKTYKNIGIASKDDFYSMIRTNIILNYTNKLASNIEMKASELKYDNIMKRIN